jgi:hypothetical protein
MNRKRHNPRPQTNTDNLKTEDVDALIRKALTVKRPSNGWPWENKRVPKPKPTKS